MLRLVFDLGCIVLMSFTPLCGLKLKCVWPEVCSVAPVATPHSAVTESLSTPVHHCSKLKREENNVST